MEDWDRQCADGKGRDDHVGSEPLIDKRTVSSFLLSICIDPLTREDSWSYHSPDNVQALIRPFILRHTFNASLLDLVFACEALDFGIGSVAI